MDTLSSLPHAYQSCLATLYRQYAAANATRQSAAPNFLSGYHDVHEHCHRHFACKGRFQLEHMYQKVCIVFNLFLLQIAWHRTIPWNASHDQLCCDELPGDLSVSLQFFIALAQVLDQTRSELTAHADWHAAGFALDFGNAWIMSEHAGR